MTNQTRKPARLFNPFTGEPVPPLPDCVDIYGWDFHFDAVEDTYQICAYSDTPLCLAVSFLIHRSGTIRTDIITCNDRLEGLEQLKQEAERLPIWLEQVRAMQQWMYARFH